MEQHTFKDKFIGFMDVLGFKNMVLAAEAGTGMLLSQLLEELKKFGSSDFRTQMERNGRPKVCPMSSFVEPHLDFQLTQVSDSVVISTEISPAGAINLVVHCWGSVIELLHSGIMCRGYITRGSIAHSKSNFIGSGYQKAVVAERDVTAFKRSAAERGTPFVEVDPAVCEYISGCNDVCVKTLFSRCVAGDGRVTALFPFKRLSHKFIIGYPGLAFDPVAEKCANQNVRLRIEKLKECVALFVDKTNPDAVTKSEHYIQALDAQLEICDKTDNLIDQLATGSSELPIEQH